MNINRQLRADLRGIEVGEVDNTYLAICEGASGITPDSTFVSFTLETTGYSRENHIPGC